MKGLGASFVSRSSGFTLVEVLVALAMAALGFGVVLNSIAQQMTLVATSIDRHQMLMHASEALEASLARGALGDEEVEEPIEGFSRADQEEATQTAYLYSLSAQPVTADPRIQQVSVTVKGDRGRVRLSAYRLRVKRASGDSDESNDSNGSDE